MNIAHKLHQVCAATPGEIAVIDNQSAFTYGELSVSIKNISSRFSKSGIKKGDIVAVLGDSSLDFIVMAYAVFDCDAVLIPISHQSSVNETKAVISKIPVRYLAYEARHERVIEGLQLEEIPIDHPGWRLAKLSMDTPAFEFLNDMNGAAFIRFTSGTTGSSKGVMLSHDTVEERIRCANSALKIKPGDRVLCVLSMAYHFVVSIILYLRNGACIVISKGTNAAQMLEDIRKHQITMVYAAPMQIRLLCSDTGKEAIPSVRMVISTSASIGKELCERFIGRYGIPVSQAYGIIELGLPMVNDDGGDPESVGRCVDGFEAAILDENAQSLLPGVLGELGLKGPGMLDAYLSPYKKREEILVNGWFLTGDLALKDEMGRIKIAGRKKAVINVSGNKVFPEEVEAVLEESPYVESCKVTGVPHVLTGELVQAEIVLKNGVAPPDQEELIRFCRKRLSAYKAPQRILFVERLEMTGSGKTKRT